MSTGSRVEFIVTLKENEDKSGYTAAVAASRDGQPIDDYGLQAKLNDSILRTSQFSKQSLQGRERGRPDPEKTKSLLAPLMTHYLDHERENGSPGRRDMHIRFSKGSTRSRAKPPRTVGGARTVSDATATTALSNARLPHVSGDGVYNTAEPTNMSYTYSEEAAPWFGHSF